MKQIIQVTLLVLSSLSLKAQTQAIIGQIIDKQSEYPLIGASITIIDSNPLLGTVTDIDGRFRIEGVSIGRYNLQIEYLGYEAITIPNIVVHSAKETVVNAQMEESLVQLSEVVVSANNTTKGHVTNQLATVSARSISVEEASRFSGSFGDPARMAQNYAGVSGASDDRNDIIIRGNSPLGVLWRMEGIDIPNPSHFSALGSTGGPISMLNINNLSNSDFFTSAWSADYGNALSGVFDIKLRNGNRNKREYLGQIGFNGFEIGAEGPFKKGKKSSYLANFRYSTLGVFKAAGIDFGLGDAVPEYQDLTFKMNFPTEHSGVFTLWGVGGVSDIHIAPKVEKDGNKEIFAYDATDITFGSNTGIIGASNTYFWNKKTYSKITVVASSAQTIGTIDSIAFDSTHINFYNFKHRQTKYSAHLKLNKKLTTRHTLTSGIIYDYIDLFIEDSTLYAPGIFSLTKGIDGGSSLVQAYANWQYRANENTTFNIGLHDQYYTQNQTHSLEPRFGLKYQSTPKSTFTLGAGFHSQMQPAVTYFTQDDNHNETNKDLDFSKAFHAVLGHEFLFARNMRLKSEVYYQYLYSIPVDNYPSPYSIQNGGADFIIPDAPNLVNDGTGQNYGLELTLEKFFSKGYYFLATASLFDSKYKGSDGIQRNSLFNSSYVFNGLAGKEFNIKKNQLSFDTKITYSGGRRYTPIDLEASAIAHEEILDLDHVFEEQYDPYFKIDFKISFKQNRKSIAQEWSLDLTNLTNHQNIFQRTYNVKSNKINTTYQRGFFPNILYKIYF